MPEQPGDGSVFDATRGNWVDTRAPAAWRPYLRLSRMDRPIGTWLLLIPCWWGIALAAAVDGARWGDIWLAVGCTIGAVLMRGAGCTWNDITDRDIDGSVARTASRPIPSGQVTIRQAVIWMVVQCAVSFVILMTFNWAAILMGVAALVPVAVYPFAKRFTWWPQMFLGIAFNWGALLGWVAHTGSLSWPAVVLWLAGIAWTLFYDTIYAHQDREYDAMIGVKSTARLFGHRTAWWLYGFLILTVGLMSAAVLGALGTTMDLRVILCLIAPWAMGVHMMWQMFRLDIDEPDTCLMLFRSNRNAGLIAALFFAIATFV